MITYNSSSRASSNFNYRRDPTMFERNVAECALAEGCGRDLVHVAIQRHGDHKHWMLLSPLFILKKKNLPLALVSPQVSDACQHSLCQLWLLNGWLYPCGKRGGRGRGELLLISVPTLALELPLATCCALCGRHDPEMYVGQTPSQQ